MILLLFLSSLIILLLSQFGSFCWTFFFLDICCSALSISLSIASISAVDAQHSAVQLGAQNEEQPDEHCATGIMTGGGGAGAQQEGKHAGAQAIGQDPAHPVFIGGDGGNWIETGGKLITLMGV